MGNGLDLITPPGPGGVAVLRLNDSMRKETLVRLGLSEVPRGTARLVRPQSGEEVLDEGLLVGCPDGSLELHVHGSPVLVQRLLDGAAGPDPVETGNSLEALAQERVPGAPCSSGARLLLDQGEGCLHKALEEILAGTADGLAQELLDHWRVQRYWLQPMRLVLVGQVNAGKSTLFNLMIGEEHALTSSEAGTTRDAVLGRGHLGPWPVDWIDTAGERANAPLAVERAGQEQARQAIGGADLILRLVPEGDPDSTGSPCSAGDVPELLIPSRGDQSAASLGHRSGDPDFFTPIDVLADPMMARETIRARVLGALDLPLKWRRGSRQAALFDEAQALALRAWRAGNSQPLLDLLHI